MHTPLTAPMAQRDALRRATTIGKLILIGLPLVVANQVRAQAKDDTAGSELTRVRASASDQAWDSLQTKVAAGGSSLELPADEATRQKVRTQQMTDFLAAAASAKKFQADYPGDSRKSTARVLEIRNLLKAALVGDRSQREQAFLLADELKVDRTIDPAVRFDVAFLQQQVLVRSFTSNLRDYFAACEVSARGLIKDYPDQPGGYEWLLTSVAGLEDDAKLAAAAREVISSAPPFRAKARATIISERLGLVGRSLPDFANTALGRDNLFEQAREQPTVLYTWDATDPDSIAWAADVEKLVPRKFLVIGVCLSTEVRTAAQVARQMSLSTTQHYDEAGPGSFLAMRLKLHEPGLIYVTDATGTITTVTAREGNLASLLNK